MDYRETLIRLLHHFLSFTEAALNDQYVQKRDLKLASTARNCLIRQLFCAEQLLGAVMNNDPFVEHLSRFKSAVTQASIAMNALQGYKNECH